MNCFLRESIDKKENHYEKRQKMTYFNNGSVYVQDGNLNRE